MPFVIPTAINRWTPKVNATRLVVVKYWKVIAIHFALWSTALLFSIMAIIGSYWLFYNWYIPAERIVQPIYFDYTANNPIAYAQLNLQKGLPYDISLDILVPDIARLSETLGPVVFKSRFDDPAITTIRPMLVVYRSWPIRLALLALRLLPVVLGLAHEATPHRLFLMERFTSSTETAMNLKIEMAGKLPTFSVKLEAVAHFTGLRYVMYYWKLTFASFIIGLLALGSLLIISMTLGISLYKYINKMDSEYTSSSSNSSETTSKSDGMSQKSVHSIASTISINPKPSSALASRAGWGLSSLRRRFHTTEELRVPNCANESEEDELAQ